ncbi:hypothetical protein ABXV18_24720 [Vibrio owensii]|uniref:hypothetical protein n=2 Tax=Vibrio harveyi group TaxID=717610 RepID=UPI00339A7660
MNKTILAGLITATLITGCNGDENAIHHEKDVSKPGSDMIEGDTGTDSDGHAGDSSSGNDGIDTGISDDTIIGGGGDEGNAGGSGDDHDKDDDLIIVLPPSGDGDEVIGGGGHEGEAGHGGSSGKPDGDSELIPGSDYDNDMNLIMPVHPIDPPISIPGTPGDEVIGDGGEEGTPSTPDSDTDIVEGIPDDNYDDDMNIHLPDHPIEPEPELPIHPEPDFGDDMVDGDQGGENGCSGPGCYYPSKPEGDENLGSGTLPSDDVIGDGGEEGTDSSEDSEIDVGIGDDVIDGDQGGDNGCEGEGCYYPSKPEGDENLGSGTLPSDDVIGDGGEEGSDSSEDSEIDVGIGDDVIDGDQGGDNGCEGEGCYYPSKPHPDDGVIEGMPDGDMNIPLPENPIQPEPDFGDDVVDGDQGGDNGCEGEGCYYPSKPHPDDGIVEGMPDGDMNIPLPENPIQPEPDFGDDIVDGDQGGDNGCEGEGCYYPSKPHPDDEVVEGMPDGDMNIPLPENPIQPEPDFGDDADNGNSDEGISDDSSDSDGNGDDLVAGMPSPEHPIYLEPENPIQPEPDYGDDADNGNDNDEGHAGDSNTDSDIDVGIGDDMTGSGGQDGTPSTPDYDNGGDVIEGMPDGDMNIALPENPIQPEPDYGDDADSGGEEGTPSTPDEDTDLIEGVMPDKPVKPEDPIIDDGGDGSVDGTPGTKPDGDTDFVESIPDSDYDGDMNIWIPEQPIDPDPELPIEEEPTHPIDPSPSIPGTDGDDAIEGDQGGPNGCSGPGCYYPGKPSPDDDQSDLIEGIMPDDPVKPEDPIIDDGNDGSVDGTPGTKPDEDSDFVESIPDGSYDDDMNLIIPEHPIEEKPELPIQPEPDFGDDLVDGGGVEGTPSTPDSDSDLIEGEMPDKPVTPEDPIIDDGGDGSVDGTPGTKPDEDSDFVESIPDGSYDDDMNIWIPEHPIEEEPELPIQPEPDFGDDLVDGGGVDGTPSTPDEDTDLIEGEDPSKPIDPDAPIDGDGGSDCENGECPDGSYPDGGNPDNEDGVVIPPTDGDDLVDGGVDGTPSDPVEDDTLIFSAYVEMKELDISRFRMLGKDDSQSPPQTIGVMSGSEYTMHVPTRYRYFDQGSGQEIEQPQCSAYHAPYIERVTDISRSHYVMTITAPTEIHSCRWAKPETHDYLVAKKGYKVHKLDFRVATYGNEFAHLKSNSSYNETVHSILLAEKSHYGQVGYSFSTEHGFKIEPVLKIFNEIEGANNWAVFTEDYYYTLDKGKETISKYKNITRESQIPQAAQWWGTTNEVGYPFIFNGESGGSIYAPRGNRRSNSTEYGYYALGDSSNTWGYEPLFTDPMSQLTEVQELVHTNNHHYIVTEFCTVYDKQGVMYNDEFILDRHLTDKNSQNTILVNEDRIFCLGETDHVVVGDSLVAGSFKIQPYNAVDEHFEVVSDYDVETGEKNARLSGTYLDYDAASTSISWDLKVHPFESRTEYHLSPNTGAVLKELYHLD